MATYTCPLCKATFTKYKWFVKHINRYSEEERKKIFIEDNKILTPGRLFNYVEKEEEEKTEKE